MSGKPVVTGCCVVCIVVAFVFCAGSLAVLSKFVAFVTGC